MLTGKVAMDAGTPSGSRLGKRAPLFRLPSIDGRTVASEDFRHRFHLVVVVTRQQAVDRLLPLVRELDRQGDILREMDAKAVWITGSVPEPVHLEETHNTVVLVDESGRGLEAFLGSDPEVHAGVFVVDRYGEVVLAERRRAGEEIPGAQVWLEWVQHVDLECPE